MTWNRDLTDVPKDGRWVLILDHGEPACVYWQVDADGSEFGWTSDGGDRFSPEAWAALSDEAGAPIYP